MFPEDYLIIRPENPDDADELAVIYSTNEAAFGCHDEADLVNTLRTEGAVLASLVAEIPERIVGHILFSRMSIETTRKSVSAVALAPIAVLPEYQRRGIGGKLIRHGLDLLHARGERIVIVVGHADYYPRFGFSSEKTRCLESPFPKMPSWQWNSAPVFSTVFTAVSDIRRPLAFEIKGWTDYIERK
jgi:putative acetyltransferase